MPRLDHRKLQLGTKVIFKQGDWKSSQFRAEAEIVDPASRSEVQIRITKILSDPKDVFWWRFHEGMEITAQIGELSIPR